MPVFVEDPAQFSKERLKSELIAHNVDLPPPESKKQAYVELHLKHVRTNTADFSSDEEDHVDSNTDKEAAGEMVEPGFLTDDQLKAKLLQYGVKAGPIVASTRALYERKLKRLLETAEPTSQPHVNGAGDAAVYSDSEDDDGREEDEEIDFDSEQPQSEAKPPVETTKTASRIENRFSPQSEIERKSDPRTKQRVDSWALRDFMRMEKETMTGRSLVLTPQSPRHESPHIKPVSDILSEMFPNAEKTPTGIFATKRRSIKGAAGRPVQFKYPDMLPLSPATLERQDIQQRRVPLWVQVVVFLLMVCLLYLIYCSMDESLSSPVSALLDGLQEAAETYSSHTPDSLS